MAKGFVSFLDKIGSDFKKGLDAVLPFASAAAVGISVANPEELERRYAAVITKNY